MSGIDHHDEAFLEPHGSQDPQSNPNNSPEAINDFRFSVNGDGELSDYLLRYFLRDEAVGVDRIEGQQTAGHALKKARVSGYDKIVWLRLEPGQGQEAADGELPFPEVNSIRGLEMPLREPRLWRGVVKRFRSRWTNPFFPHDGE